jgi:hypothetical protein
MGLSESLYRNSPWDYLNHYIEIDVDHHDQLSIIHEIVIPTILNFDRREIIAILNLIQYGVTLLSQAPSAI